MFKQLLLAMVIALAMLASACDGNRGYTRGVFHGMVIDKTEDEVTSKIGKPAEVKKLGDDSLRYVYRKKTFDPDNMSQIDESTFVDFERKNGKMIVVDISFG